MGKEIFKIQRPVAYGKSTECLIYNEDKSYLQQTEMPADVMAWFGKKYKIYVEGFIDEKAKTVRLDKVIKDQEW